MAVTAAMVKELREATGAGMMDCKKALTECGGDLEKATELLKEKGLLAAAKKAERVASEGLVHTMITDDNEIGVVVEVNSETDFVAKNQEFRNYVVQVAEQVIKSDTTYMEAFMDEKWDADPSMTVREALNSKISVIGEKLSIRRIDRFERQENGVLMNYIHGGGRVVALIELISKAKGSGLDEVGKNICMQVAAMNPKFVAREDVPTEFIDEQKQEMIRQAKEEGKPDSVIDRIVQGKINKLLNDICLLDQEYVKDSDMTVGKYLESVAGEIGESVSIARFVRYETGEGMEKRLENFAEEVGKAMRG